MKSELTSNERLIVQIYYAVSFAAASCYDGERNGMETGIDCGGDECFFRCSTGEACSVNSDCSSSSCDAGLCAEASFRFLAAHGSGGSGHGSGTSPAGSSGTSSAPTPASDDPSILGDSGSSTSPMAALLVAAFALLAAQLQ